jgi:hypothetical protein
MHTRYLCTYPVYMYISVIGSGLSREVESSSSSSSQTAGYVHISSHTVMKICTVIGQSSDMYLRSTRTNEIPARTQLHTSVDRQTAAHATDAEQVEYVHRAAVALPTDASRILHGRRYMYRMARLNMLGRQGRERQSATNGSGQSNISGDVAKVSSRSQSHPIANLF